MAIEEKKKITEDELMFGLLLLNKLWFIKFFWKSDTTIPDDREDLPEEWIGTQRISREQRLMMLDESDNILFCTGRKLAKCVGADSVIYDAITGERMLVSDKDKPQAISTLYGWKVREKHGFDIFPNEVVQLYKVTTRAGLTVRVSGNHPFLTGNGWVECDDLKPGDMVGVARRSPMPAEDTSGLSNAEVALLAYLIGDGGIKRSVRFSNISQVILEDFTKRVKQFDSSLRVKKAKGDNCDYRVVKSKGLRNSLKTFLRGVEGFSTGQALKVEKMKEGMRGDRGKSTPVY